MEILSNFHEYTSYIKVRKYMYMKKYCTVTAGFTVYAEKNDRSLTLNNWIPRKDKKTKCTI